MVKELGIALHLGVDGIGTPLVLASSILLFAGIFVSWHIKDRTKEFYIWLLILAAATIGVFMSLDLFFLYFFYEMSVIPMYLLLGMGSHTKKYLEMTDQEGLKKRDSVGFIFNFAANSKEYAAMKLVLFLSAWAVVALMGILLIYRYSGLNTFDILQLREHAKLMNIPVLGTTLAKIIWVLIFFGFASIAPIWPLHSWSPVGHAAAPAATSMLHAGVLMKLGHFSIIRRRLRNSPGYDPRTDADRGRALHLQHHLRRVRRVLCQGHEVRDRLFQFEPHGLCLSRHGGAELHRPERSGDLYVCARDGHGNALRHGGLGL